MRLIIWLQTTLWFSENKLSCNFFPHIFFLVTSVDFLFSSWCLIKKKKTFFPPWIQGFRFSVLWFHDTDELSKLEVNGKAAKHVPVPQKSLPDLPPPRIVSCYKFLSVWVKWRLLNYKVGGEGHIKDGHTTWRLFFTTHVFTWTVWT